MDYETFLTKPTMRLIADFIERKPIPLRKIEKGGSKFTGLPTEWQRWYTDLAETRFRFNWERTNLQPVSREGDGQDLRDAPGGEPIGM